MLTLLLLNQVLFLYNSGGQVWNFLFVYSHRPKSTNSHTQKQYCVFLTFIALSRYTDKLNVIFLVLYFNTLSYKTIPN